MTTMTAARFHAATSTLELEQTTVPDPGPGQILVRVEACGVCLTDVHLVRGVLPPLVPTVTLGHEAAGVIAAVGKDVADRWQDGMRVAITPGRQCGACWSCLRGQGAGACGRVQVMGSSYDGAWAEYVVVSQHQLAPVPDGIDLAQAAILSDAVTTPYAALLGTGGLRPAESVGIWGLGGLGTHAVMIARLTGAAPIVAVGPSPASRERALRLGADLALDPADPSCDERIRQITDGRGLDLAAEFVGLNEVRVKAVESLRTGGRAVLVGLHPEPLALGDPFPFVMGAKTVRGHLGGDLHHLEELLNLVARHRLDLTGSVTATVPLSDIHTAMDMAQDRGQAPVRIVVSPTA